MYGGPRDGGLRRETGLPLAPGRCRWATWSTTQADSPESRGSATTTCWDRGASTSSPEAPTWWCGYRSPPARCGGSLPWPRIYSSLTAPSRHSSSSWGWAGSRTPRTPSGSSPCAGTGEPTGWWSPHRPAPPRDSRISPRPLLLRWHQRPLSR